jgi:hypothetical protein
MPIDPTGTQPGVVPAPEKPVTVNMKCRKGNCPGITVTIVVIGASPVRMYRCCECGHTWGINVGGSIDI